MVGSAFRLLNAMIILQANTPGLPLAEILRVQPKKIASGYLGDLPPHIYPSSCFLYFGVVSEFYSPDTLTIKYKNSKRSWPQSHGILSRRDFGTWNSSSSDFGRSVWRVRLAISFQIHRAHASHVLGLSRNCTLPCICCPGPVFWNRQRKTRFVHQLFFCANHLVEQIISQPALHVHHVLPSVLGPALFYGW